MTLGLPAWPCEAWARLLLRVAKLSEETAVELVVVLCSDASAVNPGVLISVSSQTEINGFWGIAERGSVPTSSKGREKWGARHPLP
jgi:hypothetical protein